MEPNKLPTSTPSGATKRNWSDLSPDSESGVSPELKRLGVDKAIFDNLKFWIANQLEELKSELSVENDELKKELASLREELRLKDLRIYELESNIQMVINSKDKAHDTCPNSIVGTEYDAQNQIQELKVQMEEQQQYSRRHSLRLEGLGPFNNGSNDEDYYKDIIIRAAKKVDINLTRSDIDRAHPSGKTKKQLICRFSNYSARRKLYQNRKKFRFVQDTRGIYVNEDLTSWRYYVFKQLLALKKQGVVQNAWTNDGRLFVWLNDKKVLIKTQADVDALASQ